MNEKSLRQIDTFDIIRISYSTPYVNSVNYAKFVDDNLLETLYSVDKCTNIQKRIFILSDIFLQNKRGANMRYLS